MKKIFVVLVAISVIFAMAGLANSGSSKAPSKSPTIVIKPSTTVPNYTRTPSPKESSVPSYVKPQVIPQLQPPLKGTVREAPESVYKRNYQNQQTINDFLFQN